MGAWSVSTKSTQTKTTVTAHPRIDSICFIDDMKQKQKLEKHTAVHFAFEDIYGDTARVFVFGGLANWWTTSLLVNPEKCIGLGTFVINII